MISFQVICLLAAHFIGDWLLQSRKMAMTKSSSHRVLWTHVGIVTLVLAVPVLIFAPQSVWLLIPNALLHAFIDWNLWSGYKASIPADQLATYPYWTKKEFYDHIAVDQFMHLFLIYLFFL